MPVSEVKIDRFFVADICTDATDAAIVGAMIGLALGLGLGVVAEGVEDELTWRRLNELGCDLAQGYYYARPLPAREFDAFLRAVERSPAELAVVS